jgi:hypothetical protein
MDYQMKQSGGLTDAQFEANPQQSLEIETGLELHGMFSQYN